MMEFRILGGLEAESGGGPVSLGWPFERRVLAALLLDAGRVVPVPRLVDATWDDDPPATASKQVKNAVSRLRRVLAEAGGGDLIVTVPGGYRLAVDHCTVDARDFEAGVTAAGRAASGGKLAEAVGLLRSALALWRGPALAGLSGRWLELAAAAWEERRVTAHEMCSGFELALGRHREVLGELARLAADYPLREHLAGLHMVALYRCGRQADALTVYHATRELLAEQLGVDPGPELRQLQQQILTADPVLALRDTTSVAVGHAGSPLSAAATTVGMPSAVPQVRHGLPADTAAFTGRRVELEQITTEVKVAAAGDGTGGVASVGAIDGMPGVGKTALAVHVAHVLAHEFPDRQLFIDLHGHTPGQEPVRPEDALAGLLAAMGVDPRYLPGDLGGRAGMWRDRMAGQRALLVLDNAASSAQVAPLLPGAGGCLVLVTSRRHLGDLPGAAIPIMVDVLPPEEATEMFTRLAPRAARNHQHVAEVVALVGYLPLAVSLLARVFARHPSWTLADLAGETRARLLTMTAENSSVAAAFGVSYRYLDPARQRFFRLLSVHPGTTTDVYAAAALAGTRPDQAVGHLDALYREGLLTETGYGRYGMHDLIRRYARDLAAEDVPVDSQHAVGRLLDYYQHTTALAGKRLALQARPGPAAAAPEGFEFPALEDAGRALNWVRTERSSLLACLDLATRTGLHARVVALTAGLAELLWRDGPWADAITRHSAAVDAARHVGDRLGEANALSDLGYARSLSDAYPGAAQLVEQALGIYRDLGNRLGEANALRGLGNVAYARCDYADAAGLFEQALGVYRDLGYRLGEANVLTGLGSVRYGRGDYPGAAGLFDQALGVYRDLGERLGEATALLYLGAVRELTGDYLDAAHLMEAALGTYRDLGDRLGEANALHELGIVERLRGDYPRAAGLLEEAMCIYRDLGSRLGEAHTLSELGAVERLRGDYHGAAGLLEQALRIHHDLGRGLGEAHTLTELGAVGRLRGDYPGAAGCLEQALGVYRDLGSRLGEADVLNEQGTLYRVHGDLVRARECHDQAMDLAHATGSTRDEACAVAGLGRCAVAAGQTTQAAVLLGQALEVFQRIGAAEAQDVVAELDGLTRLGGRTISTGLAEITCPIARARYY